MSRFEPGKCPNCGGPMPYLSSCQTCGYLPDDVKSEKFNATLGCLFGLFILSVIFGNFVYSSFFPDPTAEERLAVIRQLREDGKFRVDEATGDVMILKTDWDSAMGGYEGVESGMTVLHRGWIYSCSSDDEDAVNVELLADIEKDNTGARKWLRVRGVVVKVMTDDPENPGQRHFEYTQHFI